MLRPILLALLALATLADASAQTTPTTATTKRSTAATRTVKHTPAKKRAVRKKTTRATTKMGMANTTMQPDNKTGQQRDDIGPGGNGVMGSREPASGKGQGVYAAPGMAVKTAPSANADNYRGEAPKTNPRKGNTYSTPASTR